MSTGERLLERIEEAKTLEDLLAIQQEIERTEDPSVIDAGEALMMAIDRWKDPRG